MKQTSILTLFLLLSMVLVAACSPSATPTLDANTVITQAVQTAAVQLTLTAGAAPATIAPTNPPLPTDTLPAPVEQRTLPPSVTDTPATPSTAPTSAPQPASQDGGTFVSDVTIPDGTGAAPGVKFDKIWRVKNTGKTTWDAAYSLVPIEGDPMGSPDSIRMPKDVRPGDTVDITVSLTAPTKPGSYQTFFRLRNAQGQFFRLDQTGDLWVKISVGGNTATPDLTATAGVTPTMEAPTATPTPMP